MSTTTSDAQVGLGWTGRVMQVLGAVWTLVLVNLLFIAGVVVGLVVAGIMPAAAAASAVLLRDAEQIEHRGGAARLFVREYRRVFVRANLAGLPLLLAAALLVADALVLPRLDGPAAAALTVLTTVVGIGALLAGVIVATLLARYDDAPMALLRYAVTVVLASPFTALGILVTAGAVAVITAVFPVALPLVGASLPLVIAARLVDHRLAKLDPQHPNATSA